MKKWQKEIESILLDDEEEVLRKLEKTYQQSLKDVQKHAKELQNDLDKLIANDPDNENLIRSKVYQLNYQKALEKQINGYMDVIKSENTKDINDYLKTVYSDGFMTQQYGLMRQGINITMPINQKLLVKSITYKTEDIPLSTRIYKNVEKAKTTIISEISRGLSVGMSSTDIARNLENAMGVSSRKAWQLAQNEGARVRKDSTIDCLKEARKKGADVVKMWDATMDSKTRPIHAELHGKWAEINKDFEYSGGKVFAPKEFGIPALDINCRCALLIVPRWDVDDSARHYDNAWRENGNDKMYVDVKNYEDWKKLYSDSIEASSYSGKQAKKSISQIDYKEVVKVDNAVQDVFKNIFDGYNPSKLVDGEESTANLAIQKRKDFTYKYETSISNASMSAGDSNVDIGNSTLANSIHERTHDIINQLAMKNASIYDLNNVTFIQDVLFWQEKEKISQNVYIDCFNDESFAEIKEIIEKEISKRATEGGEEFIAESMVRYLGNEKKSELAEKVYNYLVRMWKNV